MAKIEEIFRSVFSAWKIEIPPEDVGQRRRGKLVHGGWAICHLFVSNKKRLKIPPIDAEM